MEQHYKLHRLRELADNDEDFLLALAQAFLEEVPADAMLLKQAVENNNKPQAYQVSHKMKPTIDVFELGILDKLIEIQDWVKFEKEDEDMTNQLILVLDAIEKATSEIKADFNL